MFIEQAAYLMGLVDEYNILETDEVYCHINKALINKKK